MLYMVWAHLFLINVHTLGTKLGKDVVVVCCIVVSAPRAHRECECVTQSIHGWKRCKRLAHTLAHDTILVQWSVGLDAISSTTVYTMQMEMGAAGKMVICIFKSIGCAVH